MSKPKIIFISALAVFLVVGGVLRASGQAGGGVEKLFEHVENYYEGSGIGSEEGLVGGGTGTTHRQKESFVQGLFVGTTRQLNIDNTGAFVGQLTVDRLRFAGGNTALATQTGASSTLAASEACGLSIATWTPTDGGTAITLPSYAAMQADCIPAVGDQRILFLHNAGLASTTITTWTAGASSTVDHVSSSTLSGQNLARLTFLNTTATNGSDMLRVLIETGQF
jgi:hypothetical protein|tara:strand:- start:21757 stop:22428 length:672 start_codon:yes stop_codon:yes gene_type:complete